MKIQNIVTITGSPHEVARFGDVGLFPGQQIQVMRKGLWKVNGAFTVALRLTNVEIVLE